MVAGIVALFLIGRGLDWDDTVFWVELWGLTLFGAGWLLAGSYRDDDTKTLT